MGFLRGNSYYALVDGPTWEEARSNAIKLGGDLVVINNIKENELVSSLFMEKEGRVFIGLTDSQEEGNWKWVDGSKPKYTQWMNLRGFSEPTAGSRRNYGILHTYGWNDWNSGIGAWHSHDGNGLKGVAELQRDKAISKGLPGTGISTFSIEGQTIFNEGENGYITIKRSGDSDALSQAEGIIVSMSSINAKHQGESEGDWSAWDKPGRGQDYWAHFNWGITFQPGMKEFRVPIRTVEDGDVETNERMNISIRSSGT